MVDTEVDEAEVVLPPPPPPPLAAGAAAAADAAFDASTLSCVDSMPGVTPSRPVKLLRDCLMIVGGGEDFCCIPLKMKYPTIRVKGWQ